MFSVWRKLTGKHDGKPNFPSGVAPIGESMQKKYAKGVQYNMKIIIKGDRNTGKSALFRRLNGKGFVEEYIPTHEIQVANVNWNYQGAVDIVKVEVWDIVDKSEKKKSSSADALKIVNDDEDTEQPEASNAMALDAEFLNVYKGTHGVILTLDITKAWTWAYVQRELEKIPHRIPVLVLGNFRDMGERRVVQTDEIIAHIEHLERPTGSAEVYFTESSMKDGYGLHFAYKFLNMPFLILQRETLLKQLEANTLEIEETRESLHINSVYGEASYSNFKELLANKENPPPGNKEEIKDENVEEEEDAKSTPSNDVSLDNSTSVDATVNNNLQPLPPLAKLDISGKSLPVATVSPTVHSVDTPKESVFKTYTKKIFGGDSSADNRDDGARGNPEEEIAGSPIGDFDTGQLPSDFLDSSTKSTKHIEKSKVIHDSDDDYEDGNPMVASYADLDDDELKTFEQQLSNDGEFEDLSDDERRELEQPSESIIEKIKSERTTVNVPNGYHDYSDLDSDMQYENEDVCNIQCDIDSDSQSIQTLERIPSNMENGVKEKHDDIGFEVDVVEKVPVKNEVIDDSINQNKNSEKKTECSDEDDDNGDEPVYIITGDIDVEDDPSWLVNESSDHETKPKPSTSSKNESCTTHPAPSSELNFELDELEMFMKDQMEKKTYSVEENCSVPDIEHTASDSSRPKKKKKKKKTETEEEPTVNTEKKKKKKVISTETIETPSAEEPKKKTKKSKSSTTPSEKEKKTKKTKKKENTEMSELDSFYEGL